MFDDPPSPPALATRCDRLPDGQVWYLAQLKPNSLEIARRNLARQGFLVFVPQRVETRRLGGRFRTGPFPLFPGYLFVALDPAEGRWRAVNGTKGVTRIVAFGVHPAPVPAGLVEDIAQACGRPIRGRGSGRASRSASPAAPLRAFGPGSNGPTRIVASGC